MTNLTGIEEGEETVKRPIQSRGLSILSIKLTAKVKF